jgi:hypothetical protein
VITITSGGVNPSALVPSSRLCRVCTEPISQLRLTALPDTTICRPCLELEGDVPRVRRLDEYRLDGEDVIEVNQSYFTNDQYKSDYLNRLRSF